MKQLLVTILFAAVSASTVSAQDTDIVEARLIGAHQDGVTDVRRITMRQGYDSQPLYLSDSAFYYTSMRHGVTQIMRYDRPKDKHTQLTFNDLNEYSPTPRSKDSFSAVQGAEQHLVEYNAYSSSSTKVTEQAMVGYHAWQPLEQGERLWMAVVEGTEDAPVMNLYLQENGEKSGTLITNNIGRSLKTRNTELITFQGRTLIAIDEQLNLSNIGTLPDATTDITVDRKGRIWAGSGVRLMKHVNSQWQLVHDFSEFAEENQLESISRIDIAPSLRHVVVVFDRRAS